VIEETFYKFTEYKIPLNLKRVVTYFISNEDTRFIGFEFYGEQGKKLLSEGFVKDSSVETILDDDERIVGIKSRNQYQAVHYDF
jgi:hypothetical protein